MIDIRVATPEDASALVAIYAPYVEETTITFDYDVPGTEEFVQRIQETLERYPYVVAEEKGHILGYAYAHAYKDRAAYDWAVEVSVYVDPQETWQWRWKAFISDFGRNIEKAECCYFNRLYYWRQCGQLEIS